MFGLGQKVWLDKNVDPSLLTNKLWLVFMRMKQFFFVQINSKWPTQKSEFFKIANSQYIFLKILWIGPWISRIN